MKNTITLDGNDINKAILDFVDNAGFNTANMTTTVKFVAGRGGNGNTAEVTLEPETEDGQVVEEVVIPSVDKGATKTAKKDKVIDKKPDPSKDKPAAEKEEEDKIVEAGSTEEASNTDAEKSSDADADDESLFN